MGKHRQRHKPKNLPPTTRISVICFDDSGRILLVKHRKGARQYWVLPGGRLEYGETFHECAVRELKEETGLDIEVEGIVYLSEAIAPDRSRHIVNIYMTARVTGGQLKVGNESVLAGVDYLTLEEMSREVLYPPIGEHIINSCKNGFSKEITYLGNMWV